MAKYVIDLDSTIIDTSRSIINLHNKLNENKITFVENHDWNFAPMVTKYELPKLFELFDNKDFYDKSTLVVFDNAIEVINGLSMQNDVIICSKHDILRRPITQKWIYETFPTVKLIFTDSFDKGIVGKCDFALDDKPEALSSIDAKYKLCYGLYKWNSDYEGRRVTNWLDFKEFVRNIDS